MARRETVTRYAAVGRRRRITYACNTGPAGVACDVCAAVVPVDLIEKRGLGMLLLCRRCRHKNPCDRCGRFFGQLVLEVGGTRLRCGPCDRRAA